MGLIEAETIHNTGKILKRIRTTASAHFMVRVLVFGGSAQVAEIKRAIRPKTVPYIPTPTSNPSLRNDIKSISTPKP